MKTRGDIKCSKERNKQVALGVALPISIVEDGARGEVITGVVTKGDLVFDEVVCGTNTVFCVCELVPSPFVNECFNGGVCAVGDGGWLCEIHDVTFGKRDGVRRSIVMVFGAGLNKPAMFYKTLDGT